MSRTPAVDREKDPEVKWVVDKVELRAITFTYSKKQLDRGGRGTGKFRQSIEMMIEIKDCPKKLRDEIKLLVLEALEE